MSNDMCLHCPHGAHPGLVCWASHMGDDCGCTGTPPERTVPVLILPLMQEEEYNAPAKDLVGHRRASIVELEDHREVWQTWWSVCLACGHHVVTVIHETTNGFLDCSKCSERRVIATAPATGSPVSTKL